MLRTSIKKGSRQGSSKKGIAIDLDWIISLGIFLVYLGFFFAMIRQLSSPQSQTEALLANVHDGVIDMTDWHVQRLPLLITSNHTGTEPVIVRFPYPWQNFSFQGNVSFDKKDGRLIFVKSLTEGKNLAELVTSSDNYSTPLTTFELTASPASASVNPQRFSSDFTNALPTRANHFDKERLSDFNISITGIELKPETATIEANITPFSAQYKVAFTQLNHTSIIVAGYSRILTIVTTAAKEPHNLTVSMTLRNYTSFYVNTQASGSINYTTSLCTSARTSYIDFSDELSGLSFIAPNGANMSFCAGNTTVRFGLTFSLENETRYDMIFHPGSFNNTLKYQSPYRTAFGIAENITGISRELYKKMNETDYQALKRNWSYPSAREFSIALLNGSGSLVFNYQPVIPGITNIFARQSDVFLLDKYGEKTKHTLRIRGW